MRNTGGSSIVPPASTISIGKKPSHRRDGDLTRGVRADIESNRAMNPGDLTVSESPFL